MSFPSGSGIIAPDDFAVVHRVFSDIVAESWFTMSMERRELFALTVIDAYRQGHTDPIRLSDHCRAVALCEFGNAADAR